MCIEFLWENLLVNSYMEDQEGEGGGFAWSPLLPDLNPCDFSVGLFQDRVIQKNMQTIHELKTIISSKFNGFLWLL